MSLLATGLALGGAAAAGAAWYALPFAARRRGERRLRALCAARRMLVLTYDDGPGPELTPRLLELLEERGARATFFVLGRRAAEAPELLDRMKDAGHEIGSHSQNHINAWKCVPFAAARDTETSYDRLARWVPADGAYRPPYGKITLDLWWNALRKDRPLGWWTDVSGDTYGRLPEPTALVSTVEARGGGVVLLHDFDRRTADAEERAAYVLRVTADLLDLAARSGIEVGTLSDLVARRGA